MASLDTNVLVRWLVADDPAQTAQVDALLEAAQASATQFFVPVTVLLELEWVLRSRYRMDKPSILLAMTGFVSTVAFCKFLLR